MKLRIPQATEKGYVEVEPWGAFDWQHPNSPTRRGRVQDGGRVCPTIQTSNEIYVFEAKE